MCVHEILEHYGMGLLELFATAAALAVVVACIRSGGMIYDAVLSYMAGICG